MQVGGLRARIDANVEGAIKGIQRVGREMKNLTRTDTVVRVRLDVKGVQAQIKPVLQQLRALQKTSFNTAVTVNVKTDIKAAEAGIRKVKADANDLRKLAPIGLRFDAKGAQQQLKPVLQQLRALQKTSTAFTVSANVTAALQKLRQVYDLLVKIKDTAKTAITIKVSGASATALADINRRLVQLTGSGTNWSNTAKRAAAATRDLGVSAAGSGGALERLKRTLVAFGGGYLIIRSFSMAFKALKDTFIDFNNTLAQAEVGFTTLFYNTGQSIEEAEERAASLLHTLKMYAIPTPFALADLAPLAQQMMAFGLISKQAQDVGKDMTDMLTKIGDAAYGLGAGKQGIDRVILALGQMKVATRVMGQEMLQLQQIGINAWEYLSEATGKSTAEVRKYVEQGLVPADDAIRVILAGMERDFHGGMERAAQTLGGAWENVLDALAVKFSEATEDQYEALRKLVVDISDILDTEAFSQWVGEFFDKAAAVFAFVTGAFEGLLAELQAGNPVIISILTAIGARFIWLQAVAIQAAIKGVAAFATTLPGQLLIATAVVAAFAAAYSNNMYGVRDVTNEVVSFINRQLAGFAKAYAWIIEKVAGLLQRVPDFVFEMLPGGVGLGPLMLKRLLGDQSGLKEQVETYWDEILASIKSPDGLNVGSGLKLDLFGDFKRMLAEAQKEIKNAQKSAASTAEGIPGLDLGELGAGGAAAKNAAALKNNLNAAAKTWDDYASAVERAARRQIDALKGVSDSLSSVIDDMKKDLLKAGIIDDPLQPTVDRIAKFFNVPGRAQEVATAAQKRIDFARDRSAQFRAASERISEQSTSAVGAAPASGTGVGQAVINEIANAVNTPMGKAACARFVSFAFKRMGVAVETTDAAGQLVRNAVKAGAREVPAAQARAGDLVYQYGRRYGVIKDRHGAGYHVGVSLGDGRVAAKNKNYVGPIWKDARVLSTSALAGGGGISKQLQAQANATGRAQVAVRDIGTPPPAISGDTLKQQADAIPEALSLMGVLPKGWGGGVELTERTRAQSSYQEWLATPEGRAELLKKVKSFDPAKGNQIDQATWHFRTLAKRLDEDYYKAMEPKRIKDAGLATVEFVQAKRRELGVLRESSKYLRANGHDVLELAKVQEEAKIRAEAETDERLKGIPAKQREWNITKRVTTAVHALVESYRHNAFAAHHQRISELDKEYSALGLSTLEAQITQRVLNQENAKSLTLDEKRLEIAKELRNERTRQSIEAAAETRQRARELRREIENRSIRNPLDELAARYRASDEERLLRDPGYVVDIDERAARSQERYQTRVKFQIESQEEALKRVQELYEDQELTLEKIASLWSEIGERIRRGELDASAGLSEETRAALEGKVRRGEASGTLAELSDRIKTFYNDTARRGQEYASQMMTPFQKTREAAGELRAELAAVLNQMKLRGVDVKQFSKQFEELNKFLDSTVEAAKNLETSEYRDKLKEIALGLQRSVGMTRIFDPVKREIEEWKQWLRSQGIAEKDIEGFLPFKQMEIDARKTRDVLEQIFRGLEDSLRNAFDRLYTEGPGKFFKNLLDGLARALQQMAVDILVSEAMGLLQKVFDRASGGGGGWFGKVLSKFTGFSTGLDRVPYDDYVVRVHRDEAILTARDAKEWRAQRKENARNGSGGQSTSGGGTTIIQQYHVGQVVANNPEEFRRQLPGRQASPHELERQLAMHSARGAQGI